MSKVLILGGSGQLGTSLVEELARRGTPGEAPGREILDLSRDDVEQSVCDRAPAALINAAAYNDVGGAEHSPGTEQAVRMNRDLPETLAHVCAALGIPLVHVSTDYVFDGEASRPYREEDPVAPLQPYGRSKLEGERAVLRAYPEAVVARTSTLYGRGRRGGSNYVDAVLGQARTKRVLEVVRTPVSSPTYARDLALGLLALLDAGASGLVHLVNDGSCSRLDLAREAVRLAGLADRVEVRERPEPPGGPRRPAYSALDTSRFAGITGSRPRPWLEALAGYLESPPPRSPS